ncbi:hypothetical protein [Accumulibacter sp.]|uniref:hypothetical protein n=1 Tax=Accumulibacter sp. TaxID=2053492 RepID=UPI0025F190AD|nr:hypothetical protein [Accumulibacter sp.]MCM8613076.1 hypothetical protein [Accumulibacter sp.]MCM8636724.1 hypothetical protein [Accumulibacter sp.]MCM8640375.1 hypothetical protein [Accumulibacter sp.]
MADDGDLIRRADSLIGSDAGATGAEPHGTPRHGRRRRSFVASTADRPAIEGGTMAGGEDEDLPLLTEVVPPATGAATEVPAAVAASLRSRLAGDLCQQLEQRLASETPVLIASTLDSAGVQLRRGITAAIVAVLDDFLAQRGQLPLPGLEECSSPATDRARRVTAEATDDPL